MEISFLIFLGGGLFLGWALGANDSANVFGTAVGTRMLRFGVAATLCSIGVILGAVISGAGPTETLNKLASINALSDAGIASACAGLTVFLMTWRG
ncbi:MAG: inorganic phosphate transporter, partial [Arenicellales bacterium]|nr:inorganic phosphate transporter [Arenicellales bacterium]